MDIYLAEKLKNLRAEKGISQEKLAQYLNVSFQAVSKWENGNTYPDITLLPEIARFFGITVDELLQVEKIDEKKLYAEYEQKSYEQYRNDREVPLALWQEAHHVMPNNLAVKEMLMSSYYDTDKVKYQKEIIELGTELYNASLVPEADNANEKSHHSCAYYRGQVIEELSKIYAVIGDTKSAEEWAEKASFLMHAQELLFTEITHGEELLSYFRFANYWYFKKLFYMCCRVTEDEELSQDGFDQEMFETLGKLYDVLYPDGDAEFEMLDILCVIHRCIAEDEANGKKNEETVREHLTRACEFAEKSVNIQTHPSTHPFFKGWTICESPTDNKQIVRRLQEEFMWDCFAPYRNAAWFTELTEKLGNC